MHRGPGDCPETVLPALKPPPKHRLPRHVTVGTTRPLLPRSLTGTSPTLLNALKPPSHFQTPGSSPWATCTPQRSAAPPWARTASGPRASYRWPQQPPPQPRTPQPPTLQPPPQPPLLPGCGSTRPGGPAGCRARGPTPGGGSAATRARSMPLRLGRPPLGTTGRSLGSRRRRRPRRRGSCALRARARSW